MDQPASTSDLRIAVMRLARRLRSERTDDSLTPSQMAVLGTLVRLGPQSPTDLAALEKVRPPSMTRILATLEDMDLIERFPHPTDRRQSVVQITPGAEEMVLRDRERRDQWLNRQLDLLDPADRHLLMAATPILNRIAVG